jgi:Ca-activated chloride channel family protein
MDLLWPGMLLLLILIPAAIALYVWVLRRRRRFTVRFSSLSLLREVLPKQSRIRRHLPFAIFLLALTSLMLALTRPVAIISVPTNQTTIILVLDVSMSMRANDIKPSRLEAAEAAAMSFIERQKSGTQIGIVAFSGFAEIIQSPTTNQEVLQAAIESLTVGRRTAIGSGILKGLDAIAEVDPNVAPSVTDPNNDPGILPVPKGAYAPDVIVLLTDGVSNAGITPMEAAVQAADRGVRIYTIGFGTENGGTIPNGGGGGRPQGNDPFFGGGGGGGGGFRLGIDEKVLKDVADLTGGSYYVATSANELNSVFQNLPTYLITKHEVTEISVFFAAFGALLAAAAIFLSLAWHPLL